MRRLALVAACLLFGASPAPLLTGLDHIPIAVRNLGQARRDYERLGFVLKPGRPHADGISNAHVKFLDRTEIELITAARPSDRLAAEYVDFLRGGDGPAFWGLRAPDLSRISAALQALKLAPDNDGEIVTFAQASLPHRVFFADSGPSPTDAPEYFVHPNTAFHLQAIWISAEPGESGLLERLGASRLRAPICAPFAGQADLVRLAQGEVAFVQPAAGRAPQRSIIGATVLVHSLDSARTVLARNHVPFKALACTKSLWVPPDAAHGAWLEFRPP